MNISCSLRVRAGSVERGAYIHLRSNAMCMNRATKGRGPELSAIPANALSTVGGWVDQTLWHGYAEDCVQSEWCC